MSREVIVAKTAGFCFGVERAVEKVYEQIEAQAREEIRGPIYTYGPIIHNEEVVRDLGEKGVRVLETEEDLRRLPANQGTVIIRSHGVSRHIYDILKERGVEIVDATCPEEDSSDRRRALGSRGCGGDYRKPVPPRSGRHQRLGKCGYGGDRK